MNFEMIQNRVTELFEEMMEEEGIVQLTPEQMANWPLDKRARPSVMWSSPDCEVLIIQKRYVNNLNYYGGFEYVKKDHCMEIGDYVIFSADSDRVSEVLEPMFETE